jgi:hypothetical protein
MPKQPEAMKELRAALTGAPGTHSPLYQWMRDNYEDFDALLSETRPNWKRLAEAFAQLGLTDGNGNPPKPHTVRQTWWRVRRGDTTQPGTPQRPQPPPIAPSEPLRSSASDVLARLKSELNERSGRKS